CSRSGIYYGSTPFDFW
nr:immunoglobulin heavy chain junction region [Mus musculus]MBK4188903.1 immunoglobulin heavy chain junction region [Mus musculus]